MGLLATLSARALKVAGNCFRGFFHPVRNDTPAHWHQFRGATIGELDDIDGVGWSDVVVGLQIPNGARARQHRQPLFRSPDVFFVCHGSPL
jgi:hypothetical protein